MKFMPDTVSKPIVGEEAQQLASVLKKGEHIVNEIALETIARIIKRRFHDDATNLGGR